MSLLRAIYWTDANSKTRLVVLEGNVSLATVQAALAAKSNAQVYREFEGTRVNSVPAPVAATYESVNDAAQLVYTDASGSLLRVTLPAPVQSIFMADQSTVDPAQVAAITAAVVGTLLTPAGGVVTAYVSGVRIPTGRTLD